MHLFIYTLMNPLDHKSFLTSFDTEKWILHLEQTFDTEKYITSQSSNFNNSFDRKRKVQKFKSLSIGNQNKEDLLFFFLLYIHPMSLLSDIIKLNFIIRAHINW